MPKEIRDLKIPCPVCPRKDREWIEYLISNGAYFQDIRREFGIPEMELRRHDALHSTKQPTIDPLTVLRQMRWLNEQAEKLFRREMTDAHAREDVVRRRQRALKVSLDVVNSYSRLIDAPKHLDPRVVLPRWHQTILKLSERLKDIPGAMEALSEWAKEESPPDAGVVVKTEQVQELIEDERENPSYHLPYNHSHHKCAGCGYRYRCYVPDCPDPNKLCLKCEAKRDQANGAVSEK